MMIPDYTKPLLDQDISAFSNPNPKDSKIITKILKHEGIGRAILEFDKYKNRLTDYCYWYMLGTLWVSYTGWSELRMWKRLFSSNRPNRKMCLMKPSEVEYFDKLPEEFVVYRAKRENEGDCIAYTLDPEVAGQWAIKRGVNVVHSYRVCKKDVLTIFLRRNEMEVIILNQENVHLLDVLQCELIEDAVIEGIHD